MPVATSLRQADGATIWRAARPIVRLFHGTGRRLGGRDGRFFAFVLARAVRAISGWKYPGSKNQTLHGTAIYTYIDPANHPNVGIYVILGVSGKGICLRELTGCGLKSASTLWVRRPTLPSDRQAKSVSLK